jgi:hypothetical protein
MTLNYLFGYGSLINKESRMATGKTRSATPVRLSGYQRAWNVAAPAMQMAGLGIYAQTDAVCNGVLIEIDENELPAFDLREINGSNFNYDRIEIPGEMVTGNGIGSDHPIWAYQVRNRTIPSDEFPIAQSYVDVILTGCLDIGESYAAEFITRTLGWEFAWINDRGTPRYARHLENIEHLEQIERLLNLYAPQGFKNRKNLG